MGIVFDIKKTNYDFRSRSRILEFFIEDFGVLFLDLAEIPRLPVFLFWFLEDRIISTALTKGLGKYISCYHRTNQVQTVL
jgi:hypothetical protein